VRGKLKPGRNHLRIIVTNALANRYIHNRSHERWPPGQPGRYYPRALELGKGSLEAGLLGPARILGAAGAAQ